MTRAARLYLAGALLVPWLFIWQGLDFTDQGYLLTGYRCFFRHPEVTEDSGHMWLTNLVGASWDALFGGLGVVGMRGLWALCMSAGAWLAFQAVRRLTDERAAALAVLVSSAFLSNRRETWFSYNTASSLLFVGASVCTLYGVMRKSPRFLFAAGALIGISPFARFPNILCCALISAVWLAALLDPERRPRWWRDSALVVLGAIAGVAVMLAAIALRGDFELYWEGLLSLFAPSMQNAGYATDDLASNFIKDQAWALASGLAVCVVAFGVSRALPKLPAVLQWLLLASAAGAGIFVLAREGEPWRFVVPGTSYFVLVALVAGAWRRSVEVRVAAWAMLIIVTIAPLGSNNGIKNAHMGLWLALPLWLAVIATTDGKWLSGQGSKLALIGAVVLGGEACHRAWTYTYRDQPRAELLTGLAHPQLRGQLTTPARARKVSEVLAALEKRVAPGDYLLAYEGTPLIQYLTRTRPYLNRPWLMGWERGDVVKQLLRRAPRRTGCLPVVVVTTRTTRDFAWPTGRRRLEQREPQRSVRKALQNFLKDKGYERTWENGFFQILEPPADKRRACR